MATSSFFKASTARVGNASLRCAAKDVAGPSRVRYIHETQVLDPVSMAEVETPMPPSASSFDGLQQDFEGPLEAVSSRPNHVHVKLGYLHPRTKPQPRPVVTAEGTTLPFTKMPRHFVPLTSHVFGMPPRRDVLHSAVVYYLDAQRAGTASTKTRSDVAYSGRKIRPQKGSGNARLGTRSNPLLRGGGVIHGPHPRDHSTKLPRRVRELALRTALSVRWRAGDLHVVKSLEWDGPPGTTGPLRCLLGAKGWSDVLFLSAPRKPAASEHSMMTDARPSAADPVYTPKQVASHEYHLRNFNIALNNIPKTELIRLHMLTEEAQRAARTPQEKKKPGELHAYEVLLRKKVVLDLGAVEWLEEKLGGSQFTETHSEADLQSLREMLGNYSAAETDATQSVAEQIQAEEALSEEEQALEDELHSEADSLLENAGVGHEGETKKL